jgi:hypothetical protein
VLLPASELEKSPVPNAIAVMKLQDIKVRRHTNREIDIRER